MTSLATSPRQRREIRDLFGVGNNVPVKIIPGGRLTPRLLGTRGGHFTRGGRRVYHPGAYAKKGWSNLVYHCSTQRIFVGELCIAP